MTQHYVLDIVAPQHLNQSGPLHVDSSTYHGFRHSDPRATARVLYPVILMVMKTAISMPDETFQRAEREAKKHGMSRSEFFTKAAVRYLDELETESLTHLIDQVIDTQVQSDDSTLDAVNVGHRLLAGMDEDW